MPRRKDDVLRTGTVTVEAGGKVYSASYNVLRSGIVRLETGQATQRGGLTEEQTARTLLQGIVDSGLADREGRGRPKAK